MDFFFKIFVEHWRFFGQGFHIATIFPFRTNIANFSLNFCKNSIVATKSLVECIKKSGFSLETRNVSILADADRTFIADFWKTAFEMWRNTSSTCLLNVCIAVWDDRNDFTRRDKLRSSDVVLAGNQVISMRAKLIWRNHVSRDKEEISDARVKDCRGLATIKAMCMCVTHRAWEWNAAA